MALRSSTIFSNIPNFNFLKLQISLSLMASVQVISLLLFLLFLAARGQQKQPNLIRLGSYLYPNSYPPAWLSTSRLFAFGFYRQGNGFAVGIWLTDKTKKTVVWTANRDYPPVTANSILEFTSSGNLTLRTEQGDKKPIATLDNSAVSASMLDSGNFVLYNNETEVVWQSFDSPTDTILGGQNLSTGKKLISSKSISDHSSGRFYIEMQEDGNLVAYPVNSTGKKEDAYWSTQTNGLEVSGLNLSSTGSLCLSDDGLIVKVLANSSYSVKKMTIIHRATLDADGNFRLYAHRFDGTSVSPEWSALQNQCEVTGTCGFNSFCSGTSIADCDCFPGFLFLNPDMKFLGCYASFNDEEGCRENKPALFYNITGWDNITLVGYPYTVLLMNKEDCSESCLEDCNCGAAIYMSGTCNKLKLPLQFARNDNVSATVFIKGMFPQAANQNPSIPRNPRVVSLVTESKKKLILILAASLGSIAFLCTLIAMSSVFVYGRRVHRYKRLSENSNLGLTQEFTLRSFSYNELEKAADGFKEELGRGSFGAVYKGTISEGNKVVAIKRLEKVVIKGEMEFRAEMTAIARTHHRNLVRLLGFCMEGPRKLLVYEYMRNGSLADLLFNIERRLIWKDRVRIALDIARGILYLHEECETQIIHCDIKPQNILVDDSWTAKISDFGLAKLLTLNQTGTITGIRGTRGYVAPEWQRNALITVKADVYSFGVVLMEIVCCRRNMEVDVSTADEVLLSTWVYNCFVAGDLGRLVGDEEVDMKALERMVKVGLLCVQDNPSLRPPMKNVILMLEGTMDVPLPPSPTPCLVSV